MKNDSITLRMDLKTLNKLHRYFGVYKNESAANYFERLAELVKECKTR